MRKPTAKPSVFISGRELCSASGVIYERFGDKWHPMIDFNGPDWKVYRNGKPAYEIADEMLAREVKAAVVERLCS